MNAMRVRLLAAMGLSSLVGCPQPKEPSSLPTSDDAGIAAAQTGTATSMPSAPLDAAPSDPPPVAFIDAGAMPTLVDASSAAPEAAVVAVVDAGTDAGKKKKPPGIEPLPKTAWYVTYPLTNPPQSYCKNGSAACVPLAWAVQHHGKPGQTTCPPQIIEKCRCPAGSSCMGKGGGDGLDYDEPCPDTFHTAITNKERAGGKKDACCYAQPVMCTPPWVGRALRSDTDETLRAIATARDDWSIAHASIDRTLSDDERAAVTAHYAEVAAGEHASVASFAYVSLELMAHGAPPELIEATHRAALDEIEHARLAYSLATSFGGAPVGPGPLSVSRSIAPSMRDLAVSTFLDACVPEAIGALLAAEVARAATEPSVGRAMERIAEDEARHAELAFRTLAWAVRVGGDEVRSALKEALARAEAPRPSTSRTLPSHGLLGTNAEASIIARAMTSVVVPCVEALLV